MRVAAAACCASLTFAAPASALDFEPYVRVGAEAGWEANITGRERIEAEPLASFFAAGASDALGVAILDAGTDIGLTDMLGLYAGLGARSIGYSRYPAFGYVTGSAALQARALDLPGDVDATLGYGYRDDFQGWRGHWLSATLERPLPWALVGYASAGFDWSLAGDSLGDRSGPYVDLGLRRRFRQTGTSVRAGLDLANPIYGSARRDLQASGLVGVSQRITRGVYLTGKARLDWITSTEPNRSYLAPGFAVGWAWILP